MRLRSLLPLIILLLLPAAAGAQTDAALRDSIRHFFDRGIVVDGARAELVEVLRWPETTGALRWSMPEFNNHPERLSLIAEQGEGTTLRRWYIPVRLNWWTRAVVAKRDLPVRSNLLPEMLTTARVNVAGHFGSWWQKKSELKGTRLTRPLKTGDVVYTAYVHRPKLIRRGDQVTMIASYGSLQVTATGKALAPASIGDRISVRNLKSKQVVQGIVASASTVHVITGEKL